MPKKLDDYWKMSVSNSKNREYFHKVENMKHLQPYIYEIVHRLIGIRKEQHLAPFVAIEPEIIKIVISDVKATIEEMEQDGLFTHSENINGIKMLREKEEPK